MSRLGDSGDSSASRQSEGVRGVGLRRPPLLGVVVLTLSYVSVLYHVTDVVGGSETLLLTVGTMAVLATVLGRFLRLRSALIITAIIVGSGLVAYFFSVPAASRELFTVGRVTADVVALLTGLSVLRLTKAGMWALAIAPGPVFLSWYLAVRGRYVWAVAVGGGVLSFFVLTGDASSATTLVGVVGATAAIGFDTLSVRGGLTSQFDTLVVVLAAMVVLSATLSIVPGGAAQPLLENRGSPTVESSLVSSQDRISMQGSIRLSPKVRFEVHTESDDGPVQYWQTEAYDRYTGDGWVRSGEDKSYDGRLGGPPGSSRTVVQTVTAKKRMTALPGAWKPVSVDGVPSSSVQVTQQGTLNLEEGSVVKQNESFRVRSEMPQYTTEQLRRSGDDYPDFVTDDYLQLPESTSNRLREKANDVAGDEENAYDKARAVERYLEQNKRYSLTVQRPNGNWADAFLFEMDAGYCTYYATTMVVMLRSQGVPARFVSGYTTGQQVDDGKYVVRGLDSHAWVQVYFPEVGWVDFDPTPASQRQTAESARLEEARRNQNEGVDTDETRPATPTPTSPNESETSTTTTTTAGNETDVTTGERSTVNPSRILDEENRQNGGNTTASPSESGEGTPPAGGGVPSMPSRETLGVGLALMVGLAAGARRTGVTKRVSRFVWMYYQGARRNPVADTERAFDRLEYLLERRYRPRRPRETPRNYLRALSNVGLDERAREVGRLYEKAHYGPGVSREQADKAVGLVDDMVREETPLVGRFSNRR